MANISIDNKRLDGTTLSSVYIPEKSITGFTTSRKTLQGQAQVGKIVLSGTITTAESLVMVIGGGISDISLTVSENSTLSEAALEIAAQLNEESDIKLAWVDSETPEAVYFKMVVLKPFSVVDVTGETNVVVTTSVQRYGWYDELYVLEVLTMAGNHVLWSESDKSTFDAGVVERLQEFGFSAGTPISVNVVYSLR